MTQRIPHTVTITVPIAVVPVAGNQLAIVGGDGIVVNVIPSASVVVITEDREVEV